MTFLQRYWLISQMAEAALTRAISLFLTGSTKDEFPSDRSEHTIETPAIPTSYPGN